MQRGFLLEPCCKDESWIAAFLAYVVQFGGAAQAGKRAAGCHR